MAKRTSIKIDSELMQGIEAQIKEKPWFKSRTKFAEEAIKNEIKKLEDEENASIFSLIRAYYNEKQIYYAEHGIFGFEDFIKKVVLNENVADIVKKAGQESKETNKKIEELTKKLEEYQKRDLSDKDADRIIEQMRKTRPEWMRAIESAYAEAHKKTRIALNEEMKRKFGMTDKDLEEFEVWKRGMLKKIKEKEGKVNY